MELKEESKKMALGRYPVHGAIFMSNMSTMVECVKTKLFGLPANQVGFVRQIKAGMILFLFEYETRNLYGVFKATSDGGININRHAYSSSGKQFPAQVEVTRIWNCFPLSENLFRGAIEENYFGRYKFNFGLRKEQVHMLLELFDVRKAAAHNYHTLEKNNRRKRNDRNFNEEGETEKIVSHHIKFQKKKLKMGFDAESHVSFVENDTSQFNAGNLAPSDEVFVAKMGGKESVFSFVENESSHSNTEKSVYTDEGVMAKSEFPSLAHGDMNIGPESVPSIVKAKSFNSHPEPTSSVDKFILSIDTFGSPGSKCKQTEDLPSDYANAPDTSSSGHQINGCFAQSVHHQPFTSGNVSACYASGGSDSICKQPKGMFHDYANRPETPCPQSLIPSAACYNLSAGHELWGHFPQSNQSHPYTYENVSRLMTSGGSDSTFKWPEGISRRPDCDLEHPNFHFFLPFPTSHNISSRQGLCSGSFDHPGNESYKLDTSDGFNNDLGDFIPIPPDDFDPAYVNNAIEEDECVRNSKMETFHEPYVPQIPNFIARSHGQENTRDLFSASVLNRVECHATQQSSSITNSSSRTGNCQQSVCDNDLKFVAVNWQNNSDLERKDQYSSTKGLYSDTRNNRASVFSRLNFASRDFEEERNDGAQVVKSANQRTDKSVCEIMEELQERHEYWMKMVNKDKSMEKENKEVKKRKSVFLRLTKTSETAVEDSELKMCLLEGGKQKPVAKSTNQQREYRNESLKMLDRKTGFSKTMPRESENSIRNLNDPTKLNNCMQKGTTEYALEVDAMEKTCSGQKMMESIQEFLEMHQKVDGIKDTTPSAENKLSVGDQLEGNLIPLLDKHADRPKAENKFSVGDQVEGNLMQPLPDKHEDKAIISDDCIITCSIQGMTQEIREFLEMHGKAYGIKDTPSAGNKFSVGDQGARILMQPLLDIHEDKNVISESCSTIQLVSKESSAGNECSGCSGSPVQSKRISDSQEAFSNKDGEFTSKENKEKIGGILTCKESNAGETVVSL